MTTPFTVGEAEGRRPGFVPASVTQTGTSMGAFVYHGPGRKRWEEVPKPVLLAPTDAIVRVDATTICDTDIRTVNGDVPAVTAGRILGHEAVGTIESVGSRVRNFAVGDRVLVSCITACGTCEFCLEGSHGRCIGGGGRLLGNTIDGTQAEFVRVPFAATSMFRVPPRVSDEQMLMLAELLPTGYEVGVLNGHVQPGDLVVVLGAGAVGLAAIVGSRLFSPAHIVAIDKSDRRLERAKGFGADIAVNIEREDPLAIIRQLNGGLGADVTIETVGEAAMFELATQLTRHRGHVANVESGGRPADYLDDLWSLDMAITTGSVDTYSIPTLLRLTTGHQIDADRFVTHHLRLDQFDDAYDIFSRSEETGALKVVLSRA